nr:MAG TPA: hypothetical protein [Caudoviricetes sp.]
MKLLDKMTKWFFKTTKIEVNTDWRLVALDTNRENIDLKEQLKGVNQRYHDKCVENEILYQRIADLEKLLGV